MTINIGGAEAALLSCEFVTDSCGFRANFDATLDDLLAALAADPGDELLMTMAYYNPASGKGDASETNFDDELLGDDLLLACNTGVPENTGLNDIIAEVSSEHGVEMANPYPAFKAGGQAYMADSLHANGAGYDAIAESFKVAGPAC